MERKTIIVNNYYDIQEAFYLVDNHGWKIILATPSQFILQKEVIK